MKIDFLPGFVPVELAAFTRHWPQLPYTSRETWRFWRSAVRDWGRILIRSFGIANWFYGLTGFYFLVDGLWRVRHFGFGPKPYEAEAYYFDVAVNALFVFGIFLSGYWLILIRRRGAVLSNYIFSTEILFFVLSSWASLILAMSRNATAASIGESFGAVGGIGNMGTVLQLLTGYPVIALVALNLARRHVDRNRSWNAFQPSRPVGSHQG